MLTPTQQEVQREAIKSALAEVHTALPGKVVSYDKLTQTANVQPTVRHSVEKLDGSQELETYPVLPSVPIVWMRAGGYSLRLPLAEGDHVLLVFSEAATAMWRATGQISEPGDLRRHDLSYAFAIPGIAPDLGVLTPQVDDLAFFDGDVWRFGGGPTGVTAKFVAIAEKVMTELGAIRTAFNAHAHTGVTTGAGTSGTPVTPLAAAADVAATKLKSE